MAEPKPISLVQVDAGDYSGPEPKPYKVVGPVPGGAVLPAWFPTELGTAGQVLTVNEDATAAEWVTPAAE